MGKTQGTYYSETKVYYIYFNVFNFLICFLSIERYIKDHFQFLGYFKIYTLYISHFLNLLL